MALSGQGSRDPTSLHQGRQLGHLVDAATPPGTLVHLDAGQRCHLALEAPLVDGDDGPLVAREGEVLHLVAAYVPLLGNQLGAPEL